MLTDKIVKNFIIFVFNSRQINVFSELVSQQTFHPLLYLFVCKEFQTPWKHSDLFWSIHSMCFCFVFVFMEICFSMGYTWWYWAFSWHRFIISPRMDSSARCCVGLGFVWGQLCSMPPPLYWSITYLPLQPTCHQIALKMH